MHPRIEEVLGYLDTCRNELSEAVNLVPASMRERQPGPDRWSVAQVLDHLTMIDRRVGIGLKKWIAEARAANLGTETETSSVVNTIPVSSIKDRSRRVNAPEAIRPSTEVSAAAAWVALESAREDLRSAFIAGDGLALTEVIQPHPVLGPINIYQWVLFVGSHEARHADQVREIASELRLS